MASLWQARAVFNQVYQLTEYYDEYLKIKYLSALMQYYEHNAQGGGGLSLDFPQTFLVSL